jgi:hypothetical protein
MSTPQNQNQILNAKMEVVKEFKTENGGLVIIYLVTPEPQSILREFYIATFDDGFDEVAWGLGDTIENALKNAEREWNELKDELEEDNGNPFTEALQKLNEKKLTKEELQEICKAIERTAKAEYDGENVEICHFTEHNRLWIDQKDLDWLADDVDDTMAKKMRGMMKYSIDFQGGYYYYDY